MLRTKIVSYQDLVSVFFLTLICFALAPFAMASANHSYEPAQFENDGSEYISRMKFPVVSENTSMVVRCYAHVHIDGFAGDAECFGSTLDGSDTPYVKAVLRATRNFKVLPAKLNGQNVPVWFNFSVQFLQNDGNQTIKMFPNHLRYGMFYGGQYSAPQRIQAHSAERLIKSAVRVDMEKAGFTLANPEVSMRAVKNKCGEAKFLRTETRVSSRGVPLEALIASKEEDGECEEMAPSTPLRGEFIPAFVDGKPIAAVYSESFGRSAYSKPLGKCHDHTLAHGFRILQDSGGACEQ